MASLMWRFVSAKRLFRDLSEFNSKLVEHHTQSPICKFKMLAVWPSIAEGFPTARTFTFIQQELTNTCENIVRGKSDAAIEL